MSLFPSEREERMRQIVAYLKKTYPHPKSELQYDTPFQFVVAVILSAQCTDKLVNTVTEGLFKKYRSPRDFAQADLATFTQEIARINYYQAKAKYIIAAAKKVCEEFAENVPENARDLQTLPGVGYKTAHVVLGELFDIWEGIATDTHVKRLAFRFDLTDQTDPTKISKDLEALTPRKDWKYVNNGLVLYGRYMCPARVHDCSHHPLTKIWPPAADRWPRA